MIDPATRNSDGNGGMLLGSLFFFLSKLPFLSLTFSRPLLEIHGGERMESPRRGGGRAWTTMASAPLGPDDPAGGEPGHAPVGGRPTGQDRAYAVDVPRGQVTGRGAFPKTYQVTTWPCPSKQEERPPDRGRPGRGPLLSGRLLVRGHAGGPVPLQAEGDRASVACGPCAGGYLGMRTESMM